MGSDTIKEIAKRIKDNGLTYQLDVIGFYYDLSKYNVDVLITTDEGQYSRTFYDLEITGNLPSTGAIKTLVKNRFDQIINS